MMRDGCLLVVVAILGVTLCGQVARAETTDFSSLSCPSDRELVRELLELQVSGVRVAGRKDSCVAPEKFPHVITRPPPEDVVGEVVVPRFVSEDKPFEIRSIQKDNRERLVVDFIYNVVGKNGVTAIEDRIFIRRYDGFAKKHLGCAAAVYLPETLVIRKSCYTP
ncbi:MAG: hypothetical protein NDI61_13080 [Bdellovibrionaceae bacterium]|nr:hypothetical protein [Pseudobdellovibrionaceae bacterium]